MLFQVTPPFHIKRKKNRHVFPMDCFGTGMKQLLKVTRKPTKTICIGRLSTKKAKPAFLWLLMGYKMSQKVSQKQKFNNKIGLHFRV